jgi:glycosyltransferase involved in cell wall biosynthesis
MKISIITVCYNSASTLEATILSVKMQTYSNIEYIIVDGGSSDNTLDIIKKYEVEFKGNFKWISEPDRGLYDAMNKGIKLASGDIIGLINSDDLFCDEQAIEKVMMAFNQSPKLDSVYADLYYVSQHNTDNIVRKWISGKQRLFNSGWHPAHPTLYLKKSVYENYGFFNIDFKLAADFEFMLRIFDKYKISTFYLAEVLVKMRLGGKTNKSILNIYKQNIECINAFLINELSVNRILYPLFRVLPKLFQF